MSDFQDAMQSGDKRKQLIALRDVLAEAMDDLHGSIKKNEGLCRKCGGSLSEAGLASLAQRLTQTLDAIDALPDPHKELSTLDELRIKRDKRAGVADASDPARAELGTKHAERRRGSRRTGGVGRSGSGPVGSGRPSEVPDSTA